MALPPNSTLPIVQPIGDVLRQSAPLAHLQQLIRASNARFEVIRTLLPAPLVQQLQAGPIDDDGWTLLAANSAAAAKLRQWLPRLEEALQQHGHAARAIKVRIAARSGR